MLSPRQRQIKDYWFFRTSLKLDCLYFGEGLFMIYNLLYIICFRTFITSYYMVSSELIIVHLSNVESRRLLCLAA